MPSDRTKRILIGRIGPAHGIRGEVVVQSFAADPADIARYGALTDAEGQRRFDLRIVEATSKKIVARVEGVGDRTAAEALRGTELYVARDQLPEAGDDEFYHADLIGLVAVTPRGDRIGRVASVANYGAGDILELEREGAGGTELVPFTDAFVPRVSLAEGLVVVILPHDDAENGDVEGDE